MFASAAFTKKEDMPANLKEMDEKERPIVEQERAEIEEYPYEHRGIGTVYGTFMGALSGLTIGGLTGNPVVPIVTTIGGGIAGYQAGKYADERCCPSILEEVGESVYEIPEQRYNRVNDKLDEIHEALKTTTHEKEARQLARAQEHFETVKANATFKKVVNPYK